MHDSPCRFRVNIQGRRSGKSYSAAREALPYILSPGSRGWVVSRNYELCDKIGRIIKEDIFFKLKLPPISKKEISGQIYYFKLAGLNSEVWIKSADNPDSLVGEGLDWLIVDEAATLPSSLIWEQYLRPTLADRNGWALFTSTPRSFNWLYDLYSRGKDDNFPDWESWQHSSLESPYFKDDIEELKRTLTHETVQQEFYADFISFAGKVYPMDRTRHIDQNLKYNPKLPVFCGIDWGYREPGVLWLQYKKTESGLGHIYIIDEICHKQNVKTDRLADMIKAKGYPVAAYYCDPAGSGTQSQSGMSEIAQFKKKGIYVRYTFDRIARNIANGVNHVRQFFEDANGMHHLSIAPNCKGFISAAENYRYPDKKVDQHLKEIPLKDGVNDHIMDALRYLLVNLIPIKQKAAGTIPW